MSLRWSAALGTGVRQIDLQHAELIDLMSTLEAAYGTGQDARIVDEVLPKLTAYVMFHFATEEALMSSLRGAKEHVAAHLQEHRVFARRIHELAGHPREPKELATFVTFLNDWLTEHIQRTDRKLGSLLAADAAVRRR